MRALIQLLLAVVLFASFASAAYNSTDHTVKCGNDPLYIINEDYYEGHPFRAVHDDKDESEWDYKNYKVRFSPMSDYRVRSTKVGSGTFSSVFKTTYIPTGRKYVFKSLVHNREWTIRKEIKVMRAVRNLPNVLPMLDVVRETNQDGEVKTAMIFDYFKQTDYDTLVNSMTKYQLKFFMYETLRTLHFAHAKGIVHRDIKPLNVLMNNQGTLDMRVIDWGHSDFYRQDTTYSIFVSSLHYKSPEILLGFQYHDYALDIWSTGCMIAELAFLEDPFFMADHYTKLVDGAENTTAIKMERFAQQLDAIAKKMGTLGLKQYVDRFADWMDVSQLEKIGNYKKQPMTNFITDRNAHLVDDELIDLLEKMLVWDHARRMTAAEALMHPWFKEVRQRAVFSDSDKSDIRRVKKMASNVIIEKS